MLSRILMLAVLVCFVSAAMGGEAAPSVSKNPIAKKVKLLFSDDFEGDNTERLKTWSTTTSNSIKFADGVVLAATTEQYTAKSIDGKERTYTRPASLSLQQPLSDNVVEFKFQFTSAEWVDVHFSGYTQYPKVNVGGNYCTVSISRRVGVSLHAPVDMVRNEKDPETGKYPRVESEHTSMRMTFEPGVWYTLAIEIVGDRARVSIDGKPIVALTSKRFSSPTEKQNLSIGVRDGTAKLDDFKLWSAERK